MGSGHYLINEEIRAPELSINDVKLRDVFVDEYLKDYNARDSALRVGFHKSVAVAWARNFMECSYVQSKIQEVQSKKFSEETVEVDRNFVLNALKREASYKGPGASHAARINALGKMATLLGMEESLKGNKNENQFPSGVMVVPVLESPDDWSNSALKSQDLLKSSVRD